MSTGHRYPAADAYEAYTLLAANLKHFCTRLELAGSLRRLLSLYGCIDRVPSERTVGDLELVCIARYEERMVDLFGDTASFNVLRERVKQYTPCPGAKNEGMKQWKIEAPLAENRGVVKSEIYTATVDTFGYIWALRTGPDEWNKKLVLSRAFGGLAPHRIHLEGGMVYRGGKLLPVPEESDFFKAMEVPYLEPHERTLKAAIGLANRRETEHA